VSASSNTDDENIIIPYDRPTMHLDVDGRSPPPTRWLMELKANAIIFGSDDADMRQMMGANFFIGCCCFESDRSEVGDLGVCKYCK
jgi:hypothetical protein